MKWLALIPWVAAAAVVLPVFVVGVAFGYVYARARARGERRPARVAAGELVPIRATSVTGPDLAMDLAMSVPPDEQRAWIRAVVKRWGHESTIQGRMH